MKKICLLAISLFSTMQPTLACTDFVVGESARVSARSMEWAADMQSRAVIHPRGEKITSLAPGGKPGLEWRSRYGFVGIDAYGLDVAVDGLNEKGLSFGLLWLPGYTSYQKIESAESALSITDFGYWILGNFQSVDEVKRALPAVRVWAPELAGFGGVPTAHLALHDASGKNLVVEFVDGEMKVYDNEKGVLTNAPTFDWHLINLKNYDGLDARNRSALVPGQGSGMLGLPGDWTPPSRFVRTAAILRYAQKPESEKAAVNLCQHVLNAVDIPRGVISEELGGKTYFDYTQWSVIKILSPSPRLLYRTYDDNAFKTLEIKPEDFVEGAKRRYVTLSDSK